MALNQERVNREKLLIFVMDPLTSVQGTVVVVQAGRQAGRQAGSRVLSEALNLVDARYV